MTLIVPEGTATQRKLQQSLAMMRFDIARQIIPSLVGEEYRRFVEEEDENLRSYARDATIAADQLGYLFNHVNGRYYNRSEDINFDRQMWFLNPENEVNPDIIRQLISERKLPTPPSSTLNVKRPVFAAMAFADGLMQSAGLGTKTQPDEPSEG